MLIDEVTPQKSAYPGFAYKNPIHCEAEYYEENQKME